MKKLIALAPLFFCLFVTAQKSKKESSETVVGNVKNLADLKYEVNGTDTNYTVKFRDASVSGMRAYGHIRFTGKEHFEKLYTAISTVNANPQTYREKPLDVDLGEDKIGIRSYKMFGSTRAIVYAAGGYFYIDQKDLDVLFGKKS